MKIVVLDGHVANPGDLSWDALGALGDLTVYERSTPDEVIARAAGAEAVFINKVELNKAVIDSLPDLRFIGIFATGYNNIDIAAAAARGITVCNVPGYSGALVAQTVFALLLEITNKVSLYNSSVHDGDWANCIDFSYSLGPTEELDGMTMGVYGFGNIGSRVGRIATALGMNVISPTSKTADKLPSWLERVSFDEMLVRADVISINAPLTETTLGLFNADVISRMKPGAILINTSRGPIVDEDALAEALRSGHLHAAALDVMTQEPPRADNPLLAPELRDKVIITPHIAWQSVAARRRLLDISASNLRSFINGEPVNVVS